MLTTTEDRPLDFINTRVRPHLRIINAAMDDDPRSPSSVVINGRIDPNTLRFLKFDESYQRPLAERADIFEALKSGTIVPNIEIGVRGTDFEVEGRDVVIHSPAYGIDGRQRVGNALRLMELMSEINIRMFATVHFGTDDIWERHRFTELNKNVRKVSPNLHLRNMRDSNEAVLTLYGLSNNTKDFALYKRVSWSQNMARGELMTALGLAIVARKLHMHTSGMGSRSAVEIASGLLKCSNVIGLTHFRRNVSTFFNIVDECWGLHGIEVRQRAPQIKEPFLSELARMFSNHPMFWEGDNRVLAVLSDDRRKLSKFHIHDPHIANLCGSHGASTKLLYQMLVDHMNSGRRTNVLISRYAD